MKLLTKYNRVNLLATILVFVVAGLCYYFILQHVLVSQLDDDLKTEEQEIINFVKQQNKLPASADYPDQQVVVAQTVLPVGRSIRTVDIPDKEDEGEFVKTRRLVFTLKISEANYKISVYKSQQETEDMVQLIVMITLAMVLLLLLILFIINRFVLVKLWHPFNQTLDALKQFNISSKKSISMPQTNINEFKELNNAVAMMSNHVMKEYEAIKSFTENASHEIQTPLAIITSKLELLLQAENFSEAQVKDFETIQREISRLSKLNQSLLLLTKIDNSQFSETSPMEIDRIILKQLDNFEELIAAKQITLTKNIETGTQVLINESITELLISNLLINAIKHNFDQGSINISLNNKQLLITNTGEPLQTNPEEMFERFKKDRPQSESLGLGLSIVQKICDLYNMELQYSYGNGLHSISILFP